MLIYIVLVSLILVLNSARKRGTISDERFCTITCILFILVTGLRHNDVGSDTTGYFLAFNQIGRMSLPDVIALNKRDIGFYIFEWLVYQMFHSFTALTLIAACIFYIPITKLFYKNSDDIGLSYIVLMAFMFFQFSMTGIRQTIALGFAVLFMLELNSEHRHSLIHIMRIALFACLGILFHRSFVAVLPLLVIRFFDKRKSIAWVCLLLVPVVFILRLRITGAALNVFNTLGFDLAEFSSNTGGITTYVVYVLLFVWGLFLTYSGNEYGEMPTFYLLIMGIAVVLQNFVFVNSIFFRVVWYYSIYMTVYIPKIVTSSRIAEQSRGLLSSIMYVGLLYMYFGITMGSATVLPYKFFWQGM